MAKITFLGATGTVTGSRFLLRTEKQNLLVDCGLFQGLKQLRQRNREPFPFPPAQLDRVFLTHAHIDHSGYLPRLWKGGFRGRVHSTHATRDLCQILLRDSGHLQEEDARWANKKGFSKHSPALPLYTVEDAEHALQLFQPRHYGEHLELDSQTRVKFKDAGHILGSSFVDIKRTVDGRSRKIFFCGDFGRPERPVLNDPVQAYNVDYLVLESTYGNRLHGKVDAKAELAKVIKHSVRRGGVLVVPAFSVGRTQTLLYLIRELQEEGTLQDIPVYVDSPMAIRTTELFDKYIHDMDLAARVQALNGKRIFQPGNLTFCRTVKESKSINEINGRAIIISASGMVTGGRILHHMLHRLPHKQNTILFIGYQAQGTRGRAMVDGARSIKIHGRQVPVKAKIAQIDGFSGHPDSNEILAWLMGFNRKPDTAFIVHGEPESSAGLARRIRDKLGWNVEVPKFGQSYELEL
ncbi:MAG: MBL fold metallo-hydrolase [Candidatus Glassbacteria bacterium]|nr:MBL fold metallo-hydrolase [Candidatus Glassbacteria bacterium]